MGGRLPRKVEGGEAILTRISTKSVSYPNNLFSIRWRNRRSGKEPLALREDGGERDRCSAKSGGFFISGEKMSIGHSSYPIRGEKARRAVWRFVGKLAAEE